MLSSPPRHNARGNGAVANVVVDAAVDLAIDAVVETTDGVSAHVNRLRTCTPASCVTAMHNTPAPFVRMAVVVACTG